jgi:hypothetical protein
MGWGSGGASLTGFSRATRLQPGHPRLGSPIRWDAGSRRDRRYRRARAVTTACRSLGGHGPAVTAVTVVIRIARAVTTVTIVPSVTAMTRRAFVTRPGGIGPPWAS